LRKQEDNLLDFKVLNLQYEVYLLVLTKVQLAQVNQKHYKIVYYIAENNTKPGRYPHIT
jgi:hypothetical protein